MSDRYSGVKSVDVACRIVEAFSNEGPRLALKDLAKAVRMPPSKVRRYLDSMVRGGVVEQDAATRHYTLGRIAFEIGLRAFAAQDPLRAGVSSGNRCIRGLLHERAEVHHLVGHRWFLESGCVSQPDLTDESSMTAAKPPARFGPLVLNMDLRTRPFRQVALIILERPFACWRNYDSDRETIPGKSQGRPTYLHRRAQSRFVRIRPESQLRGQESRFPYRSSVASPEN